MTTPAPATQTVPITGSATFDPETGVVQLDYADLALQPFVKTVIQEKIVEKIVTVAATSPDAPYARLLLADSLQPSFGLLPPPGYAGPWNTGEITPFSKLKRATAGTDKVHLTKAGRYTGYFYPGGVQIDGDDIEVADFVTGWSTDAKNSLAVGSGVKNWSVHDGRVAASLGRPTAQNSTIAVWTEEAGPGVLQRVDASGANDIIRYGGTGQRFLDVWTHENVKYQELHTDATQTSNAIDALFQRCSLQAYSAVTKYAGNSCGMFDTARMTEAEITASGGISVAMEDTYADGGAVCFNVGTRAYDKVKGNTGGPAALKALAFRRILLGPHSVLYNGVQVAGKGLNRSEVTWEQVLWAQGLKNVTKASVK